MARIQMRIKRSNAEYDDLLTPAVVFVDVAQMKRFMQPKPKYRALYDYVFRDTFWLVLVGGLL